MLELLRARARQEGLNIQTSAMDGQALQLDDNSFDMAGSRSASCSLRHAEGHPRMIASSADARARHACGVPK
jgi:hypothetical protein